MQSWAQIWVPPPEGQSSATATLKGRRRWADAYSERTSALFSSPGPPLCSPDSRLAELGAFWWPLWALTPSSADLGTAHHHPPSCPQTDAFAGGSLRPQLPGRSPAAPPSSNSPLPSSPTASPAQTTRAASNGAAQTPPPVRRGPCQLPWPWHLLPALQGRHRQDLQPEDRSHRGHQPCRRPQAGSPTTLV